MGLLHYVPDQDFIIFANYDQTWSRPKRCHEKGGIMCLREQHTSNIYMEEVIELLNWKLALGTFSQSKQCKSKQLYWKLSLVASYVFYSVNGNFLP